MNDHHTEDKLVAESDGPPPPNLKRAVHYTIATALAIVVGISVFKYINYKKELEEYFGLLGLLFSKLLYSYKVL